ncbi:hypothetical protein DMA11_19570 [Marinilabiliaceae bacterium JC017]|nr:hypothetical protein DMA11_19570 [Marinilabiliaceae bacterium JC017]
MFSVTYMQNGAYGYHFENDKNEGTAKINSNYSMHLTGNLPVYVSKSKKVIATAGVNFFRTWYETGDLIIPDAYQDIRNEFAYTTIQNDYISITPGLMYRFSLFGKPAITLGRINIYGNDLADISGVSFLGLFNVYLKDEKDETFGLGLGVSRLNESQIIPFPLISYNKKLNYNFYFNMMLPHNAHFIYRPDKKMNAKVGFYLDRFAVLHDPRVNGQSELQLKDIAVFNHVSVSRKLYKALWIRGRVGHKIIFRSDFSNMNDGEVVSTNKPFNYFMGEVSFSIQF